MHKPRAEKGTGLVNGTGMKRAIVEIHRSQCPRGSAPEPSGSAALRAFLILEVVVAAEEASALDDVARATRLSKPTAFRILTQLESAGLLLREPGDRRYSVGHRMSKLALSVMQNSPLRSGRHAILQRLVEKIGETCNVAMLDGRQMMYLDRVETSWPLRLHLAPGSRVPLHCTSGGKLFLSQMPRARWEKLIGPGPYERYTKHTVVNADELERELSRICDQGWSADREELLAGIVCLAVPVTDRAGSVIASLALQAPLARMTHAQSLEHLGALRAAAAALATTFSDPPRPVPATGKSPAKRRSRNPRSVERRNFPTSVSDLPSLRSAVCALPFAQSAKAGGGGVSMQRGSVGRRNEGRPPRPDFTRHDWAYGGNASAGGTAGNRSGRRLDRGHRADRGRPNAPPRWPADGRASTC